MFTSALKNPDYRVLKGRLESLLGLTECFFGPRALRYILGSDQDRRHASELQRVATNLYFHDTAVFAPVPSVPGCLKTFRLLFHICDKVGDILVRPDLGDCHLQEFLPAVSVLPDCGIIHRKKPQ
jgi:hypothetical protein